MYLTTETGNLAFFGFRSPRWAPVVASSPFTTFDLTPSVEAPVEDVSVAPGESATLEVLRNAAQRARLVRTLKVFSRTGFSLTRNLSSTITDETLDAAIALIECLPRRTPLPQIIPDGEGGVTMRWVARLDRLLLTLDGNYAHWVVRPGRADAEYREDVPFDRRQLPAGLLAVLDRI